MEAKGNDFEINETAGQYQTTLYMYVLNEIVFSRLELTCGRNTYRSVLPSSLPRHAQSVSPFAKNNNKESSSFKVKDLFLLALPLWSLFPIKCCAQLTRVKLIRISLSLSRREDREVTSTLMSRENKSE